MQPFRIICKPRAFSEIFFSLNDPSPQLKSSWTRREPQNFSGGRSFHRKSTLLLS